MPLLRDVRDQLGSSYLLDHVDNPVAWRTWSEDSLGEAARLDRPVFLSVGYAACHWCHVMAHESFEDPDVARLLNENFIPIKVDREERPDVDALYMAATQLVSGHGGWPMSVFLLPDGRPFMAGTYYPPVARHGQSSFTTLLNAMHDAWTNRRDAVEHQADELSRATEREVSFIDHLAPFSESLDLSHLRRRLRDDLVERFDSDGGFSEAPKFPRTSYVEALLEFDDPPARFAVGQTLDAMSRRGLYDHLRGGFARYSVDAVWHVPHFEKMLSDQALLIRTYLRAAKAMPEHTAWREVAFDTIGFVLRDLAVDQGFASALDADAGGVEGSHVTWTPHEVALALEDDRLSGDLDAALRRWRIEEPGAFEGRSIPRLGDAEPFTTPASLVPAHDALRRSRARRVQPSRDEKVILEWNAMFASALFEVATRATSGAAPHCSNRCATPTSTAQCGGVPRIDERTPAPATSRGCSTRASTPLKPPATTSGSNWLVRSRSSCSSITGTAKFRRPSRRTSATASFRAATSSTISARIPRRSSTARRLRVTPWRVAPSLVWDCCADDDDLMAVAQRLVELGASLLVSHPVAVPDLVEAAGFALAGVEVVVPGDVNELREHMNARLTRRAVLVTGAGSSPLLEGRRAGLAYVCRAGVCQLPVDTVTGLEEQLRNVGA